MSPMRLPTWPTPGRAAAIISTWLTTSDEYANPLPNRLALAFLRRPAVYSLRPDPGAGRQCGLGAGGTGRQLGHRVDPVRPLSEVAARPAGQRRHPVSAPGERRPAVLARPARRAGLLGKRLRALPAADRPALDPGVE